MKIHFLTELVCVTLVATAHVSVSAQQTEISERHIQIPGTNIHMVPSQGFELSTDFKGLAVPGETTTMIMVMEIPGPYQEIAAGFTKEALASKGMNLIRKKDVEIGTMDGVLAEISQEASGMEFYKYMLLYGNDASSTMINGMCLSDDKKRRSSIEACVESVWVDEGVKIDPREALKYSLDETAGNLVFNAVMGESLLFNRDGKRPTESADQATVLAAPSYTKTEITDRKAFSLKRLGNYPDDYEVLTEKGINKIVLDGLEGIQLFAKNLSQPGEEANQIILFEEGGGYYVILGTYVSSSEQARKDVSAVMNSFKRK